jgi:hypothetical protein
MPQLYSSRTFGLPFGKAKYNDHPLEALPTALSTRPFCVLFAIRRFTIDNATVNISRPTFTDHGILPNSHCLVVCYSSLSSPLGLLLVYAASSPRDVGFLRDVSTLFRQPETSDHVHQLRGLKQMWLYDCASGGQLNYANRFFPLNRGGCQVLDP